MLKIVHMKVNGKDVELAVDERESLLDTLRQRLGLTSVKKGCEVGECGACTAASSMNAFWIGDSSPFGPI